MPDLSLLHKATQLPLHAQMMLALIIASGLLCLSLFAIGGCRHLVRLRRYASEGLPPLPAQFPGALDQLFTAIFIAFILYSAAWQLFPSAEGTVPAVLTWGGVALSIAIHVGLYTPMLARYAITHRWRHPSHAWYYYVGLPVLVWSAIYSAALMLEGSGFTPWLVEATGCPEEQELVSAFQDGDVRMKTFITISAVLVAPLVEECCFRGFLYSTLRRWGGVVAAALVSSLLFGAIHGSLAQMLPLTLFGIAQCITYEKVRSLWLPIATHALFNSFSLLAATFITTP